MAARLIALTAAAYLALGLAGCRQPSAPPPAVEGPSTTLRLGVSDGAENLGRLLDEHRTLAGLSGPVHLMPGSNDRLLELVAGGYLDAAFVHRLPPGGSFWFTPVAVDGLVLIVHPANPIAGLTLGQLRAAFAGRATRWDQLGGPDVPIELVVREPGSGIAELFAARVLTEDALAPTALVATGDEAVAAEVSQRPGAIGLSLLGAAAGRSMLLVDGIQPAPQTAASQQYPLAAPIYFVAPAEPQGELRLLLSWLQSPTGQQVVGETYGRIG